MHTVKKINYVDGYKISLTFNDKKRKVVDLEAYLKKGVFLPIKDPEYFLKVRVVGSTIAWPNGADFCPDVLYEIGQEVEESKSAQTRARPASKKPKVISAKSNVDA